MGIGIGCGVGWGPGFGPEVVGYVGAGCGAGFSVGFTFAGIGIGLPANYIYRLPYDGNSSFTVFMIDMTCTYITAAMHYTVPSSKVFDCVHQIV